MCWSLLDSPLRGMGYALRVEALNVLKRPVKQFSSSVKYPVLPW